MHQSKTESLLVSTTARGMAKDALNSATARGLKHDDAVAEARRTVWQARWRSVLAGDDTMAQAWLDALAYLGDKGGLVAIANRAKVAVKGGAR